MVSVERQKAADRADWAYVGEGIFATIALWGGGVIGISGLELTNLIGWPVFVAGFGFAKRAESNKKRKLDMLNPEISDDDPRVQLRRNYPQEIREGAKVVASIVGKPFRRTK